MKIVILGAGQVGSSVAESLVSEQNDITVVDLDPARLRGLQDRFDLRTVTGSAAHPSVLQEAGIEDADLLIAECYAYQKPIRWHLNYPELTEHLADFGARRVILTHMSREMLAHAHEIPEACAHDGLVIDL